MPKKLRKWILWIVSRILLVAVPAWIAGYWSYRQSKLEASSGYKALEEIVDKMSPALETLISKVGRLEGRIDVLQSFIHSEHTVTAHHAPKGLVVPPAPPAKMIMPEFKATNLPDSLDAAFQQRAKK